MQTLTVSEKCRVSTQTLKFPEEKRKNKILNCYPLSSYPTVLKSASMPISHYKCDLPLPFTGIRSCFLADLVTFFQNSSFKEQLQASPIGFAVR